MLAQYSRRTHGINGLRDGAAHGFSLKRTGNTTEDRVTAEQAWDSNGERASGHIVQCSKTTIVYLLLAAGGVEIDNFDGKWIVENRGWIVEG